MRHRTVALEQRVGPHARALLDGARHDRLRRLVVPRVLRERRGRDYGEAAGEERAGEAHRPAISPTARTAASAALLLIASACTDALSPGGGTLSTADLLILPFQAGTPAPPASTFEVCNDGLTVEIIMHPDMPAPIDYVELRFPEGSLSALNGQPLNTTDCVDVTVQPRAGEYGFTLSPQGLEFVLDATPSATLLFAQFGDFSVVDDSPTYDTAQELANALDIWQEVTVDRWQIARGSGPSGTDEVSAAIDAPGTFVLAAPR